MQTATAQTTGHYATINGMNMYYEVYGSGSPLVLIHGGGSDIHVTFGRVLQQLAKHHRVIGIDLQAHGRTADRGVPTSFEQDADDVASLLQHLGIAKADIFGFSNGGTTTLQLAIRHPQLVNKLVLASALYNRTGVQPGFWEFMKTASLSNMPLPLQQAFLAINPDSNALQTMHDRDAVRMQNFKDIPDELIGKIQATALVVVGDKDVIRIEHALELSRLLPGARLLVLPSGHGDYIGELFAIANGAPQSYPAISVIEEFLLGM